MIGDHDIYSSGPFCPVYFLIDRDHRLSTFTNRVERSRLQDKGTLVKTIITETLMADTRWIRHLN